MTLRSTRSLSLHNFKESSIQISKPSLIEELNQGKIARAIELIEHRDVDPNEIDKVYHWSGLHIAARDNKLALAQALIRCGANIDCVDRIGQTPLHRACIWGNTEIVRFLLANGADFTALDSLMQTPDELARNQGHKEIAAELERQVAFLLFDALEFPYSPQVIDRMMSQVSQKREDDEKRRELKAELIRSKLEAEKEGIKIKLFEKKIVEKRVKLVEKAEKYKAEIDSLTHISNSGLSKQEVARLKVLQSKLKSLQIEFEYQKAKINKLRTRSVVSMIGELKGELLISYINN